MVLVHQILFYYVGTPRTFILARKDLIVSLLPYFSTKDRTAFRLEAGNVTYWIISSYPPYEELLVSSEILKTVIEDACTEGRVMILGADVNAYHYIWVACGSSVEVVVMQIINIKNRHYLKIVSISPSKNISF